MGTKRKKEQKEGGTRGQLDKKERANDREDKYNVIVKCNERGELQTSK